MLEVASEARFLRQRHSVCLCIGGSCAWAGLAYLEKILEGIAGAALLKGPSELLVFLGSRVWDGDRVREIPWNL